MTIALRDFRDEDGPALLALHMGAILATSDQFYSLSERQSWAYGLTAEGYARARDGGETFVLAIVDGAVAGFCSWNRDQILGLYVAPDRQGLGVGSLLLHHGEAELSRLGLIISRIHSSLPAVTFYERHGYGRTGTATHLSRGGLPMKDVLLEKPIIGIYR